jgi:hypothetical protein
MPTLNDQQREEVDAWIKERRLELSIGLVTPTHFFVTKEMDRLIRLKMADTNRILGNPLQEIIGPIAFRRIPVIVQAEEGKT